MWLVRDDEKITHIRNYKKNIPKNYFIKRVARAHTKKRKWSSLVLSHRYTHEKKKIVSARPTDHNFKLKKKMKVKMFKLGKAPLLFLMCQLACLPLSSGQESSTTTTTITTTTDTNSSATNFDNIELISDLLDLFNLAELGRQWPNINGQLTDECRMDMTQYLNGLIIKKLWALKSEYLTRLFWQPSKKPFFLHHAKPLFPCVKKMFL